MSAKPIKPDEVEVVAFASVEENRRALLREMVERLSNEEMRAESRVFAVTGVPDCRSGDATVLVLPTTRASVVFAVLAAFCRASDEAP